MCVLGLICQIWVGERGEVEMGTVCRLRPAWVRDGADSGSTGDVVAPKLSHRFVGLLIVAFALLSLFVIVASVAAMGGADQHLPAPTGVHTMPTPDPARYR